MCVSVSVKFRDYEASAVIRGAGRSLVSGSDGQPQGGTASLPHNDSSLKFQIKSLYCSNIAKSNTNTRIHASRKPGRFPQGKHTARANPTSPRTTHNPHVGLYQGSSRRCPTAQSPRRLIKRTKRFLPQQASESFRKSPDPAKPLAPALGCSADL